MSVYRLVVRCIEGNLCLFTFCLFTLVIVQVASNDNSASDLGVKDQCSCGKGEQKFKTNISLSLELIRMFI